MIKSRLHKVIFIAALFVVLAACAFALTMQPKTITVNAENLNFDKEISSQYALGDVFIPPTAKIVYGDKEYQASVSSVTFPGGRSYKSDDYVLSFPGEYSVNYTARAGSNIVVSSVGFSVYANAYSVNSANSSAYYGSIDNTDASGVALTDENGEKITTSGIIVSLAAGDKFTYKKPIDLRGKTKLDNILSLYSLPEIIGKADARILKVRLTDAYDANNYVEVVTYGNYGDEDEKNGLALYSAAGANGQPLTGLHFYANSNERTFTYQGQLYTHNKNVSYNSANGYPSFEYSLAARKGYGAGGYTVSMNYAEKQIFGCKTISPSSNGMIVDLDEPLFFDNLWDGFTTGEVYLSVSADNYVGTSFSFIITNILGEDLTKNTFLDQIAPKLDVDTPEEVPAAIVGKPYKLFSATSVDDIDGVADVATVVYRNYYSSNPVMVNVKDQAFIPTEKGIYTIIYKTLDKSGNVNTINVNVEAKVKSDLGIDFNIAQTQFKAGDLINLAKPIVTGNDGSYKLTVNVILNGSKTQIFPDENGEYFYQCMQSGEYVVEYSCTDYNSSVNETYEITVQNNQTPIFTTEVNLPPVFVNGVEYELPSHIGYDFSTGNAREVNAKIYYSFDGGEYVEYSQAKKLKVDAKECVNVKYSLGSHADSNKEYAISVTDVGINEGKYNRSKYFYGKDFDVLAADDSVSYTTVSDDAKLTFVNKLLTTDFSLKYQLKDTDFAKVIFTFTDCADSSEKLTFSMREKDGGSYYLSINGNPETIVSKSINDSSILSYKDDDKVLTVSGLSYELEDFSGFSSKLAWLDITFIDNDFATIVVSEINGQKINIDEIDNAAPVYSIKVNNDEKALGDELIVSRFIASDVLKFNARCYLTVYGPDNKPCTTIDGVTMKDVSDFTVQHVIKLNALGNYRIVGYATDGARKVNVNRQVTVKDDVAPAIALSDVKTTAGKGDVKIAKHTVTDNGEKVVVTISVQRPDMKMITVTGDKFTAEIAGTYTVTYFATDEAGNVGFASYEVVVG